MARNGRGDPEFSCFDEADESSRGSHYLTTGTEDLGFVCDMVEGYNNHSDHSTEGDYESIEGLSAEIPKEIGPQQAEQPQNEDSLRAAGSFQHRHSEQPPGQ